MAAVQRKLVHKQFNSPLGLYSDQNVKETLNRELRAFSNGTVGIELNEVPRAPYNLANSSVLKMVEEEDYEKSQPAQPSRTERQSRPRQRRPITREDVLKINRRHPKRRDISWPPLDDHSRSPSSSDEIHFDERIRKRHEIFHLKEMFNRGPIETATTNEKNNLRPSTQSKIGGTESPSNTLDHDEGSNQRAKCLYQQRCRHPEWPPQSYYEDNGNGNIKISKTMFFLPEMELHIGNVDTVRNYWQNICKRSSSAPSRRASQVDSDSDALHRWQSHENLSSTHLTSTESTNSGRLKVQATRTSTHKKDNLPLERYKSNSYNELPPLKPRRENHKDLYHIPRKLNVNNAMKAVTKMWTEGRWKSEENLKMFNRDEHSAEGMTPLHRRRQEAQRASNYYVAKSTKSTPKASDDSKNRILHSPDALSTKDDYGKVENYNLMSTSTTERYGVNSVESRNNEQAHLGHSDNYHILRGNEAVQILIDPEKKPLPCLKETPVISLQNEQNSNQRYYHSEDTNLISRNVRRDENLRDEKISQVLVSPKRHGRESEHSNEEKYERKDERTTYEDYSKSSILTNSGTQQLQRARWKMGQKRVNFTTNLALEDITSEGYEQLSLGASEDSRKADSLILQRSLVEQAITHDIQKINEYMKRAELEALKANGYAKELFAITPLQAILEKISPQKYCPPREDSFGSDARTINPSLQTSRPFPSAIGTAIQEENMPVVDRALLDLLALSVALKAFDEPVDSSEDKCTHDRTTRITELRGDGNEELSETAATSVDAISPAQNAGTDSDSVPDPELEAGDSQTENSISRTPSGTSMEKIIHSKNILSGYLITKQIQEELFTKNMHSSETDTGARSDAPDFESFAVRGQSPRQVSFQHKISLPTIDDRMSELRYAANREVVPGTQYDCKAECRLDASLDTNIIHRNSSSECQASYGSGIQKPFHDVNDSHTTPHGTGRNALLNSAAMHPMEIISQVQSSDSQATTNQINENQNNPLAESNRIQRQDTIDFLTPTDSSPTLSKLPLSDEKLKSNQLLGCICVDSVGHSRRNRAKCKKERFQFGECEHIEIDISNQKSLRNRAISINEINEAEQMRNNYGELDCPTTSGRSRCRARTAPEANNRIRSSSHPCCRQTEHLWTSLNQQHSFTSSESWYCDSPRPFMTDRFSPSKGYKRVAWPPADSAPVYATIPQAQNPPAAIYEVSSQAQQKPSPTNYSQPQQYQQQYQPKPQYNQPQNQQTQYQQSEPQYQQPQTQYQQSQPQYRQPQSQYQQSPTQYQQPQYQQSQPQYEQPQYQQSRPQYEQPQTHYQQPQQQPHYQQPQQQPHYQAPRYESSPAPQYQSSAPPAPNNYSSTVSFTGGIAKSSSPSRPIAREYTPGRIHVAGQYSAPGNFEALSPQSSGVYTSPSQPSRQAPSPCGWMPVRAPTPTRAGYTLPSSSPQYQRTNSAPQAEQYYGAYQNNYQPQATPAFQPVSHQPSAPAYNTQSYAQPPPQQQQQQYTQVKPQTSPYTRGQSAGVIQLRKETPVSQKPSPVYTSQPATVTLNGGSNMRGDMKWPPQEYKNQAEIENEERRRIAMGPACRPRRMCKDYGQFFARNALNHYYPGYKIPPGTQHMYNQY